VREEVALVEPRGTALAVPSAIWAEVSVIPFEEDIAGVLQFRATASHPGAAAEQLKVEGPYRLSGIPASGPGKVPSFWLLHISPPREAATVQVSYSIDLTRSATGAPCGGPLSVFSIGSFEWVPGNGVGPFGRPGAPSHRSE